MIFVDLLSSLLNFCQGHAAHLHRGHQRATLPAGVPQVGGELLRAREERLLQRTHLPQGHQAVHGSGRVVEVARILCIF